MDNTRQRLNKPVFFALKIEKSVFEKIEQLSQTNGSNRSKIVRGILDQYFKGEF